MIAFFYETARRWKGQGNPGWRFVYKMNKLLVNLFFFFKARRKKNYRLDEQSKIIVSLTTYPARVKGVWITIASLLQQTMPPCKIILWLAEEQFPNRELPKKLERLKRYGLEIQFCEDLKPHKKYFYTMQEYPDYYIITADDDILYPENHIENLWQGCEKYPETIICHWSHKIEMDSVGEIKDYDLWSDNGKDIPAYGTLAVGCNGVLYPPGCLPPETFQKEKVINRALFTDDLWLKCMEILNDRKTVNCNVTPLIYFNRISTLTSGLWTANTGIGNINDSNWKGLMEQYPEVKNKLVEEAAKAAE